MMMNIRKILIICEEACEDSLWFKQILGGFLKELKKRRIICEKSFIPMKAECEDAVCLIGMSSSWMQKMVDFYNDHEKTPLILSSRSDIEVSGRYHILCPDLKKTAEELKKAFEKSNRKIRALYGMDLSSEADRSRSEALDRLVSGKADIFPSTGNLKNCFQSFLPKAFRYDAVICVNGYAAVSLVKELEKEHAGLLEDLLIISFEEVLKHSKYNEWITAVDLNLESFGETAWTMLEMISAENEISSVCVKKKCRIPEIAMKTSQGAEMEDGEKDALYYDPEILQMAKIEQLFQSADDMDHHIIAMLLGGATYGEIADSCYMTEGNVKYRVKKYMNICACKTKKELLELLQEYLR